MTRLVKHNGKIGDVIYSLAALRGIYEVTKVKSHLLLVPNPPHFTVESINYLIPLLESQEYIEGAKCSDGSEGNALDLRDEWHCRLHFAMFSAQTMSVRGTGDVFFARHGETAVA